VITPPKESTQGGGQTHRNFNVPYIICGTSMFLA
jgi:hypothetical protein